MRRATAALVTILVCFAAWAHADLSERIADVTARLVDEPRNAALYVRRGELLGEAGKRDAAMADLDRARALDPNLVVVELVRGEILLEARRPADAERALERFLRSRPDHPRALALLARARANRPKLAAATWDRALVAAMEDEPLRPDWIHQREVARRAAGLAAGAPAAPRVVSAPRVFPSVPQPRTTLLRGPYLQLATPRSIVVRWRTGLPTDSVVVYGELPSRAVAKVRDARPITDHVMRLEGLSPSMRYGYAVGSSAQLLAGGDGSATFATPPPPGSATATRVWILGDSGTANADAEHERYAYAEYATGRDPDVWLMLGDNAYESGTDEEYQRAVFDMYAPLLRRTVLWPTLGNHDGYSADSSSESGPYYDIFTLPRAGEAGGVASRTEAYYSFDHANIHFVCLDSYGSDRSPGSPMLAWLEQDLRATRQTWVVAYWHHPPYSKGSHDSDYEPELYEMRENVLPILEAHGVDLVLSGHSHSYERSFLIDGHYGPSWTFGPANVRDGGAGLPYLKRAAPHAGAVYAVAGSSGQTSGGTFDHPAMFVSLDVLGPMVVDVSGSRLDAVFLDDVGAVRDRFALVKP